MIGAVWRAPLAAARLARDLVRSYRRECPVCGSRAGAELGRHCRYEHTPAELAAYAQTRGIQL